MLGATPDTSARLRSWACARAIGSSPSAGTPIASWVEIFIAQLAVDRGARRSTVAVERGEAARSTLPMPAEQREPLLLEPAPRRPTRRSWATSSTGMPAYKAGLKEGDRILAVNGKPITTWDELPLRAARHRSISRCTLARRARRSRRST